MNFCPLDQVGAEQAWTRTTGLGFIGVHWGSFINHVEGACPGSGIVLGLETAGDRKRTVRTCFHSVNKDATWILQLSDVLSELGYMGCRAT